MVGKEGGRFMPLETGEGLLVAAERARIKLFFHTLGQESIIVFLILQRQVGLGVVLHGD